MRGVTLVLTQQIADDVGDKARLPVESAGVLFVNLVEGADGDLRLLARGMRWVPEGSYVRRGHDHLSISSEGYVPYLAESECLGAIPLWVHTHPGAHSQPRPSVHDHEVEQQIADLFRLRSGSPYFGALIFAPSEDALAFTGYLAATSASPVAVHYLWEIGDRLRLTQSYDLAAPDIEPLFDRNVRAFGGAVQRALAKLHIGVVGCGGTGSAVAEQLVRLGVRHLTLVDPDHLSNSNLTRVYGSFSDDIGRPKVDIVAAHLRHIAPELRCETLRQMVTDSATARSLRCCDLVFGCTDDNAGRLVLSRLSTYLLIPVVDCGVLLTSDTDDLLTGIHGRVTTMVPGSACLLCRGRIDISRAAAELLTPGERVRREDEGYAPALGQAEPAVIAFTTLVAATAVGELLERFVGYGPVPRPSEILLRCHEREISTNVFEPRPGHFCDPTSGKLGIGVTEPFLEQTWPA